MAQRKSGEQNVHNGSFTLRQYHARADSRTLGDVFGPERHDEDSELPSGSGAQGGVANPNPCKF